MIIDLSPAEDSAESWKMSSFWRQQARHVCDETMKIYQFLFRVTEQTNAPCPAPRSACYIAWNDDDDDDATCFFDFSFPELAWAEDETKSEELSL